MKTPKIIGKIALPKNWSIVSSCLNNHNLDMEDLRSIKKLVDGAKDFAHYTEAEYFNGNHSQSYYIIRLKGDVLTVRYISTGWPYGEIDKETNYKL
jgi:hypothetical protein